MSVHILYDQFKNKSVMYCSTTGLAFGPLFDSNDAADFADSSLEAGQDPRDLTPSELATAIEAWEDKFYATGDDGIAPTTPQNAI